MGRANQPKDSVPIFIAYISMSIFAKKIGGRYGGVLETYVIHVMVLSSGMMMKKKKIKILSS